VTRERRGREQLVQSQSEGIAAAQRLLDELEALWRDRIDRIGDLVATSRTATSQTATSQTGDEA
jgi:hypothetical protein